MDAAATEHFELVRESERLECEEQVADKFHKQEEQRFKDRVGELRGRLALDTVRETKVLTNT